MAFMVTLNHAKLSEYNAGDSAFWEIYALEQITGSSDVIPGSRS